MNDNVNHPSHYTQGPVHDRCGEVVECITVTEGMNFNVGNAVKYLWRCDAKDNGQHAVQDLEKARWYITREIERRQYEAARNEPPLLPIPGKPRPERVAPSKSTTLMLTRAPAWFGALVKSLQDTLPVAVIMQASGGPTASKGTHDGGLFDVPKRGAFGEPVLNVADIDREAAFDFIRCLTGTCTCDHGKADPRRAGN